MLSKEEVKELRKIQRGKHSDAISEKYLKKWISNGIVKTNVVKYEGELLEVWCLTDYGKRILRHERIRTNWFLRGLHGFFFGI